VLHLKSLRTNTVNNIYFFVYWNPHPQTTPDLQFAPKKYSFHSLSYGNPPPLPRILKFIHHWCRYCTPI
jgi:hypothetical protein